MSDADLAVEEAPLPAPRATAPTLLHRIEYVAAVGLVAFLRLIGVERASALGGGALGVFGPLLRTISRRGEDNLRMIYPDWDEARIRRTIRGVWDNLGRTGAEFAHLDAFADGSRIAIEGIEHIGAAQRSGRPIIFVSGHFANWELMPISLKKLGVDFALVYRAANNPLIDRLVIAARARVASRWQTPKGKGARPLVDALRAGRSLALLVDQKLTDGPATALLGRMAPTGQLPARLALKYDATLLYATLERLPKARFRCVVRPPFDFVRTDDLDADIARLTRRINDALGRDIDARPEQWLWLHRRWGKTLPAPPAPQEEV